MRQKETLSDKPLASQPEIVWPPQAYPSQIPPDPLQTAFQRLQRVSSKLLCKELKGAFWRLTDSSFERSSTIPIRYTQEAQGGMATHEMRQSIMPFGESGLCAGIGKSR